jgi:hypothetical protein
VITPNPPATTLDEKPFGKLNFRLKQVAWAAITVLLTAWFCTMGPVPAVLSLVVAKHILVAILLMGMGVNRDARRRS